ncbi:MAG: protein kinase [Deltaproteobacteria bacterium]|nr:protein kinase [Deltaproteobacteria bacterium]
MTVVAANPIVGKTLDGRYTLIRPLASGGMADIFLAQKSALSGFEKPVVIKRLKERYRNDPQVVEMFLDEARIGAQLNHPNIVHVYDVGEHEEIPFIAMELILGDELSQLCKRGLEVGMFLPLGHAVDLIRQAAEGMGYFHSKRDENDDPLCVVHRDISPTNLLVTQDGGLKIIDFGIAKSAKSSSYDDKIIPGKVNYMAPEQVRGEPVDHRADLFSLGIVLYEIAVGKRLFKGRPEEVAHRVKQAKIKPPTFVRRDFPPSLEAIILRALEPHPEDRYQSALELASDLEEFLRETGLKSGPVRIARYLDDLRAKEGGERRPELVIFAESWVDDEADDVLDFDRSFAFLKDGPALEPAREAAPEPVPVNAKEELPPPPSTVTSTDSQATVSQAARVARGRGEAPRALPEEGGRECPPLTEGLPESRTPGPPVAIGQSLIDRRRAGAPWWLVIGLALTTLLALVLALAR